MQTHLQRALIEVYYAIAELGAQREGASPQEAERLESLEVRLIVIKSNLERALELLPEALEAPQQGAEPPRPPKTKQ